MTATTNKFKLKLNLSAITIKENKKLKVYISFSKLIIRTLKGSVFKV